jgi:hypothetical protein
VSALTWAEVALQQMPLSQARLRAEMEWRVITGKALGILTTIEDVPAVRPPPIAPRGRGKRESKPLRVIPVERKGAHRMLALPDGRRIAGSRRTVRTTISINR